MWLIDEETEAQERLSNFPKVTELDGKAKVSILFSVSPKALAPL